MKKLFVLGVAAMAMLAAPAKPEGKAKKEPKPNFDEEMTQACEFLIGRVDTYSSALMAALNGKASYDPGKSSLLDALQEAANSSLNTKTRAKGSRDGNEGEQTVYQMREVLSSIDSNSKSGITQLLMCMRGNEAPKRYSTLDRCYRRIQVRGFTKMLDDFDLAWDSFRTLAGEMKASEKKIRTGEADVPSGSELVVAAGLDRFASPKTCKVAPSFDREMRNLDSYLAQMDNETLDSFERTIKAMDKYLEKASKGLTEDVGRYQAAKIHPAYKQKIGELLTNEGLFLDEVGAFINASNELLANIRNPSGEVGKLRTVNGFARRNSFLLCTAPASPTGVQNYIQRVRLILMNVKDEYKAALAPCNRALRESDRPDIKGWQ